MHEPTSIRPFPPPTGPGWLPQRGIARAADDRMRCEGGAPHERLAGKRILIVEDEALLALDLQFAFEDEGAQVIGPAMSLDQALRAASSSPVLDGAILDVDLGGKEVYPVATRLCERGVPFVFHTGHGSRVKLAELFPGAITCIKPTPPETLIAMLLRLMN